MAQHRNPVKRAGRNLCFGLKHHFKNSLRRSDHRWSTIYIDSWRCTSFDCACFQQRGCPWVAWGMGKFAWLTYKCQSEVVAWKVECSGASSQAGVEGKTCPQRCQVGTASPESEFSFTTGAHLRDGLNDGKPNACRIKMTVNCQSWVSCFYQKNVRLHTDERLAEVLAEVSSMQWDIIIFSETKSSHDIVELDDGVQSHVCFGIRRKTNAARGAILMHVRHKKWAKRCVVLWEGALYVDVIRCPNWQGKSSNHRSICSTCRFFRAGLYQYFPTLK